MIFYVILLGTTRRIPIGDAQKESKREQNHITIKKKNQEIQRKAVREENKDKIATGRKEQNGKISFRSVTKQTNKK